MEEAVAEDAAVRVGGPIEGVPLQELVKDGLIEEADDADAEQDAREERRSATAHDIGR